MVPKSPVLQVLVLCAVLLCTAHAQGEEERLLKAIKSPELVNITLIGTDSYRAVLGFKTGYNVAGATFEAKCVLNGGGCGSDADGTTGSLPLKPSYVEVDVDGLLPGEEYNCFISAKVGKVSVCKGPVVVTTPSDLATLSLLVTVAGDEANNQAGGVLQCGATDSGKIVSCSESYMNGTFTPVSTATLLVPSQEARFSSFNVHTWLSSCDGIDRGVISALESVCRRSGSQCLPNSNPAQVVTTTPTLGAITSIEIVVVINRNQTAARAIPYTGPDVFLSTFFGVIGCYIDFETLEFTNCTESYTESISLMTSVDTTTLKAYLATANGTVAVCDVNATDGTFSGCDPVNENFDVPTAIYFTNNGTRSYVVSSNATFDVFTFIPSILGPGYITTCDVAADGNFENCQPAIEDLMTPTDLSISGDLAFFTQTELGLVTTCKIFPENGTFYECQDNNPKFLNPSAVEVI